MRQDRPLLGLLLMLGFCIVAPMMDAAAKLASEVVPPGQIAVLRFALQSLLLVPLILITRRAHMPKLNECALHLLRAAMILGATAFFFAAIKELPLADAMAIFFVEPFLLTLLSALILKETIGWRRLAACAIGFCGAMLVIQPAFASVGWVATYPLMTALLFAVYMLLTRSMARAQDPLTLQSYTGLAAVLIGVPILFLSNGSGSEFLDPVWVPSDMIWLFVIIGVAATFSHICLSYALAFAPASLIGPLQYLEIVTASTLGYFLFGDLLGPVGLTGVALIISSGLFLLWRERSVRQSPQEAPASAPVAPSVPSPHRPE